MLSPGQDDDAPAGRQLLLNFGLIKGPIQLIMDQAYEGNETRQLVLDLRYITVAPPKSNRLDPWK